MSPPSTDLEAPLARSRRPCRGHFAAALVRGSGGLGRQLGTARALMATATEVPGVSMTLKTWGHCLKLSHFLGVMETLGGCLFDRVPFFDNKVDLSPAVSLFLAVPSRLVGF